MLGGIDSESPRGDGAKGNQVSLVQGGYWSTRTRIWSLIPLDKKMLVSSLWCQPSSLGRKIREENRCCFKYEVYLRMPVWLKITIYFPLHKMTVYMDFHVLGNNDFENCMSTKYTV